MKTLGFCLGWLLAAPLAAQDLPHRWPGGDETSSSYTAWLEAGRPVPPAAERVLLDLPSPRLGDLTVYDNLADFQDATADLGVLALETFERNFIAEGGVDGCFSPVQQASDDPCFRPGNLIDGFQIRAGLGNVSNAWLVLLDAATLGTDSDVVGPNLRNDPDPNPTRIDFAGGPTAVALDVYEGVAGDPVAIDVSGTDGASLGNFIVEPAAPDEPEFVGLVSPVPIGRVEVLGTTVGSGELIDNLRFGGGPGRLVVEPGMVAFAPVAAGSTAAITVDVENTGHLAVELGTVDMPPAPFALDTDTCSGATLAPGAGCELEVGFAPGVPGDVSAGIGIPLAGGAGGQVLDVHGRGVAPGLAANPAALTFDGAPDTGTAVLTNVAAVPVTVGAVQDPDGPFAHTGGSCDPAPFALDPGQSCSLEFTFDAAEPGAFVATAPVVSDADTELVRIRFSGTATGD